MGTRDDFLAIVAHDLRDLLGGIVISSTVISRSALPGEIGRNTQAEAGRIARYAARMGRLIGDLVDIASIDSGKLAVSRADGDLAVVIGEAVDAFRASALARGIVLESAVNAAPLRAAFDQDRILQVLSNLISNSLTRKTSGCPWSIPARAFPRRRWNPSSSEARSSRRTTAAASASGSTSRAASWRPGGRIGAQSQPGSGTRISFTLPAR